MKRALRIDEPGEYSRKQERSDHEGDGAKALNRSLQFALLAFAHTMRHHALRCRERNVPHRNYRNRRDINSARSRETSDQHTDRTEKLADVKRATLTEPSNDSSCESAGNRRGKNADDRERKANHAGAPGVSINGVERPDHEHFVRDIREELKTGEFPQFRMGAKQHECAD